MKIKADKAFEAALDRVSKKAVEEIKQAVTKTVLNGYEKFVEEHGKNIPFLIELAKDKRIKPFLHVVDKCAFSNASMELTFDVILPKAIPHSHVKPIDTYFDALLVKQQQELIDAYWFICDLRRTCMNFDQALVKVEEYKGKFKNKKMLINKYVGEVFT